MTIRIVLYSHDSAGLGHIRRNLALAHALAGGVHGEATTGLLIAGRPEATRFTPPEGWDWLILPGIQHGSAGYESRELDLDLDGIASVRGGAFTAAVRAFQPQLIIVDRHPLGVSRELEEGLSAVRAENPACRIVLGLRDVLDAPAAAAAEWRQLGSASALRSLFDAIWVYGDPRIHDLSASGELPAGLRDLVVHTGYLAEGRIDGPYTRSEDPYVLTTVGGGSDGVELAENAAAAPVPAGYRHIVITGPQMSKADRRRVRKAAHPQAQIVRRVADMLPVIRDAGAVVSMGGYNTICEVMSTDTPALIAPRRQRREEQGIRASALERTGALDVLSSWNLNPKEIGRWFTDNVPRTVPRASIRLDGLAQIPSLAAALLYTGAEKEDDRVAV